MSRVKNWIVSILLAVAGWAFIEVAASAENEFIQVGTYMFAIGCFVVLWEVIKMQDK